MSLVLKWNNARLEDLLNDPEGPVGQLVAELSEKAALVARAAVRVRDPATKNRRRRAGRNSTAAAPGATKSGIRVHGPVRGTYGLYGGVNAPGMAGIFLEFPAVQYDRQYPFLTTALDSLELLCPAAI